MTTEERMTQASQKRIKRFADQFIRSEYVANLTSERDSDFINESERAIRVYDAAEFGLDGKTHAEVIKDWRDAFEYYLRDRRGHEYPERFAAGVKAYFDGVEKWHEKNGSLHQEIG